MNIALYITVMRLFISPIFLLIYLKHDDLNISLVSLPYALLFLFAISEFSDVIDGYLARRYNQVTDLGKLLDPMADSIYRICVFLTFTLPPVNLPMVLLFIFLYRDFVISTLRTICALKGFTLAARASGKLKAIVQAVAALGVILMLIPFSLGQLSQENLQSWSAYLVSFAAVYTILSGVEYIYANRKYIQKLLVA